MKKSHLLFFTASFPYGKGEQFIETEIKYLSKVFTKITLIPQQYKKNEHMRQLPNNVECTDPLVSDNKFKIFIKGLFNLSSFFPFLVDLFSNNSKTSLKKRFKEIIKTRYLYLKLKKHLTSSKNNTHNTLAYFYWGNEVVSAASLFSQTTIPLISRFHGFDLYDDRGAFFCLRERVLKKLINIS